jgi:hypothetical protein
MMSLPLKQRRSAYLNAFPWSPEQKGVLVCINEEVVGFDLVSLPRAYKVLHPTIVKSFAIDALIENIETAAEPDMDKASSFLREAAQCPENQYPSIGCGIDHRLRSRKIAGSALVSHKCVIHRALPKLTRVSAVQVGGRNEHAFSLFGIGSNSALRREERGIGESLQMLTNRFKKAIIHIEMTSLGCDTKTPELSESFPEDESTATAPLLSRSPTSSAGSRTVASSSNPFGEVWLARNVTGGYRAVKLVYRKYFHDDQQYERIW